MISAPNELNALLTIMDSLSDPIAIVSEDGYLLNVNQAWLALFPSSIGHALSEIVPPTAQPRLQAIWQKLIDHVNAQQFITLPVLDHPNHHNMMDFVMTVHRSSGSMQISVLLRRHQLSHQDDTRVRGAEELQQMNTLLQQEISERIRAEQEANRVYTLSVDMLGIINLKGRFEKVNPAWKRTLGYDVLQVLGHNLLNFVHPDEQDLIVNQLGMLAEQPGQYRTFEHRFVHADGSDRWLSWNAFQNEADQMVYFVARDVTERKRMDTQFRLLNKAVEASNSAITIADVLQPDEPLVYVNPAFEQITGYTSEEILGQNCRFLQREDRDQPGIQEIREALRTGEPCTVTLRNYRKDGTLFWNELRLTPMHDATGTISHFVGVATDITERIEAEQRIKSQNEALLRTNRALAEARKQAEAATRLKSEFLATMSHELRTPMNAIIGYTEIMLAGMAGEMDEEQTEYLNRVLTNAEHLLSLINDVLDLSKIEAGRVDLVRKPYHVGELLAEITAQTRGLAEEKGLTFESLLDDTLPAVMVGDPDRLKQIAINLLSNAIKFASTGYVRITLRKHGSSTWTLTVQDTGIGIPSSNQHAIFDEFRQLDATWRRQHGGTGLGLAIVRKLALLMGGSIRLQSQVDKGSTFIVFLPINIPDHK